MVVVNPYLKKKKSSAGGAAPASSVPRPGLSTGHGSASTKLPPQHVTPSKHPASARPALPQKSATKNVSLKKPPMVTPGKGSAVNAGPAPSKSNPSSSASSAQKRPPNAAAGIARNPSAAPSGIGRMPLKKGPGFLKQKLKQEIAMLKKQKQLKKLQKEADERRRKIMAEKQEKDKERQILFEKMEEERKQKQVEREKIQAMRLQEQQRKQQEKRNMEEMRERQQEELWQRHKNQAEFKYQQDLQVWRYKHQQWLQQQQQQQLALQQYHGYPLYQTPPMSADPGYPHPHAPMPPFHPGSHFTMMPGYAGMPTQLPPPPPPPLPPVLVRKPQRSVTTYAPRQKASTTNPLHTSRLCQPLQYPSPFASQGRYLVTVTLVRNPQTESSYGVNLILHKASALVDPDWLEAQEKKEFAAASGSAETSKPGAFASTDPKPVVRDQDCSKATAVTSTVAVPDSGATNETTDAPADAKVVSKPVTLNLDNAEGTTAIDVSTGNSVTPKSDKASNDLLPTATSKSTEGSTKAPTLSKSVVAPREAVSSEIEKRTESMFEYSVVLKEENTSEEAHLQQSTSPADLAQSSTAQLPATAISTANVNTKAAEPPTAITTVRSTQKRRRRVNFAVMLVREADKQNSRQPHISPDFKLQGGDIIISIGDQDLSGMIFADACKVFSSKAVHVSDYLIRTQVVVARQRKTLAASGSTASQFSSHRGSAHPVGALPILSNESMDFSSSEVAMLANCFRAGLHARNRMLGKAIPESVWLEMASVFRSSSLLRNPEITNRSADTLKKKWLELTRMKEFTISEKFRQSWTGKLREQFGEKALPFSSPVEAHALRQAARVGPRPAKGCRCGRDDHEYIFDLVCLLYADIRKRLSSEELEELLPSKDIKGKFSSKEKKTLNTVNAANKTRMLKLKELTEKEEAEDRFVAKMEEIQVKELKQAIFAPRLSSIVMSAICELQREFPLQKEEAHSDDEDEEEDDEMDEDDDVPLVSLGKRKAAATEEKSTKQQKISHIDDPKISLQYLMRLFEYVSKTWGHCYREPSQLDYAWRWELFHGTYSSDQQWDAKSLSPRLANSLPFENIQFSLTSSKALRQDVASLPDRVKQFEESLLSRGLQKTPSTVTDMNTKDEAKPMTGDSNTGVASGNLVQSSSTSDKSTGASTGELSLTPESLDQFCLAVHYLSPGGTGLYDEILALLKMEVLKVRSGIPVLTHNWFEKVDILVLDDLATYWSSDLDPEGKYCINEELRDTLEEKWVKYDYGWALADYPKELIFEYGVIDEWKETFEERLEENENRSEGIGRFGL